MHELGEIVQKQKAKLKQATKGPEFNFLSKQDWLALQRHLHKRWFAERSHPFANKKATHF